MIETPWGPLAVADAHVHFFSRAFFASLAEQKGVPVDQLAPLLNWQLPAEDPKQLAAELGPGARQAWGRESFPDREHPWRRRIGDCRRPPASRTILRLYDGESGGARRSLEQVKAALASGHMHGLCFFPAMHRYSIQDERVTALLELLTGHPRAVAFVHCGVLSVGVRKVLGLPSLFDMRYSNPIDLHGVALRFPQLRFVVPHFGAGYLREALMLCDLCPNVYLDTSSSNSWMRYEESHLDLRAVFRRALDVAGPKRLLFGTDSSYFPRGWNAHIFDAQSKALYEIGVSDEIARHIFQDNLPRLFS